MTGTWDDFLEHAKRIIKWRITLVTPTPNEEKDLDDAEIAANSVLRSYMVWRRTNFIVAAPIAGFGAIWDVVLCARSVSGDDWVYLSGLGRILVLIPYLSSLVLAITTILCSVWWKNWRRTTRILKFGWGLSFVLPLVPAIFPLETRLDRDVLLQGYVNNGTEFIARLQALKFLLALNYAFGVLPLIITFPGGSVRAAIRIRGLIPQSSLAGWILVVSAPFYSLLVLIALVIILQIAGNTLLIVGTILLTLNPWTYVVFRRLYVTTITAPEERRLDLVQRVTGLVTISAFVMILCWTWSAKVIGNCETCLVRYGDLVRFVLLAFGNSLVTTLVFGDTFFRMTVTNWQKEKARRSDGGGEAIDTLFRSIDMSIGKSSLKGAAVEGDLEAPGDDTIPANQEIDFSEAQVHDDDVPVKEGPITKSVGASSAPMVFPDVSDVSVTAKGTLCAEKVPGPSIEELEGWMKEGSDSNGSGEDCEQAENAVDSQASTKRESPSLSSDADEKVIIRVTKEPGGKTTTTKETFHHDGSVTIVKTIEQ